VGRSLKEALLDQFALLQERGLAPSEVPNEDDAPMIVVETVSRGRMSPPRRESLERFNEREEEMGFGGDFGERGARGRGPRREHGRGEDARGGERRRPPARGRTGRRPEGELEIPMPAAPFSPGGFAGPNRRPPMGGMGPRPPFRPGMGAPRPGMGGPRPQGRTELMQQKSDDRRRDEADIAEMRKLLAEFGGQEMDGEAMDAFSKALTEEVGALPPPRIMVEAIKESKSADPRKLGDAVRAYYRRRRRPAGAPPAGARGPVPQRPPVPEADAATEPEPEPTPVGASA
jgi:hypothetical protein